MYLMLNTFYDLPGAECIVSEYYQLSYTYNTTACYPSPSLLTVVYVCCQPLGSICWQRHCRVKEIIGIASFYRG